MARKMHDLIMEFQEIFTALEVDVPLLEIEGLAVAIHYIMERQVRQFHTLDHVLRLAVATDSAQSLAALFHDTVYYQVDGEIPAKVTAVIGDCVVQTEDGVFIAEGIPAEDRPFHVTTRIFNRQPGEKLSPYGGLNEFLSGLFAYKRLIGLVPETILIQVVACIEATIPFRDNACFSALAQRLTAVNHHYQFGLSAEEIEKTVQTAVLFSNEDVAGFGDSNTAVFLDGTWKLLPETNYALRNGAVYSIRDYRMAIQKMHNFLTQLTPEMIFHQYNGVPAEREWRNLLTQAQRNLTEGTQYLSIKLIAIAVVEALAELSGGDAPLALFMGEMDDDGVKKDMIEELLPPVDLSTAVDDPILRLLVFGRADEIAFDIRHSPLATYLYVTLGASTMRQLHPQAEAMFAGQLAPADFLRGIDETVVTAVSQAIAHFAITRRDVLSAKCWL